MNTVSGTDDSELERIVQKKLRELMKESQTDMKAATYPSEPVDVSDDNFEKFISRYPLVVVDFWADWCMPCRFMAPVIKELASEMAGKVVFGKLNVDQNPQTAGRFGIMSIPTLIVFKNGRPVDVAVGAMPKSRLKALIMRYLS